MGLIRGRFSKEADEAVNRYTASLPFDWKLYHYDIAGSIAHASMLARQGIISLEDSRKIIRGLKDIEKEIEQGNFKFKAELEDIHMNIEARLIEKIGPAGTRLHTARSRNDQVALDIRLYTRSSICETLQSIEQLQNALLDLAQAHQQVMLPGYTHLQRAQPVLLAHHLLAYFEMFRRDTDRFKDCLERSDVMPLGSGALAGVAYDIDRNYVARKLKFGTISCNSLDAVSDRDFILEYEAGASILMMHISRLAEEMIIWSSAEFGFIEMDDAYATGSSIMPQKKNPDVAELARGKTGRVYGRLMALLTTMKGLPLAYNKDLQEDKEGFFDTVDTVLDTLNIFTGMIATLSVRPEKMALALDKGYLLATDIADYLVKKGETFRNAHTIVGKLVSWAAQRDRTFPEISLEEYRSFSTLFEDDVYLITAVASISARNNPGGTAPEQVRAAIEAARKLMPPSGRANKKENSG
ncbi:MAG: argininosuccinate lyase [Dehalococcoidales bacterium]|nr:argininosuccinate lyase [Dehalococcoidales bacterium]